MLVRSLALLALAAPLPAFAGGYYFSDSGIIALGRGGAWVAGADAQFAQHYNPAGLIRVDRPTFNLGWSGVQQNTSFTALDDATGESLPEVKNQAAPFNVPELGFAMPVGDKFAFAFGFYSPYAPSSRYDADGAQRYSIIQAEIYQFSIGPSFAYQPVKQVTLGLGLNYQAFWVNQSLAITTGGTTDPSGDVQIGIAVRDFFTPGVNVGLLIEPIEQISIGVSALPPTTFNARGRAAIDFSGNTLEQFLDGSQYQDGDCDGLPAGATCTDEGGVLLNIQLPLVLRTGVAVRPIPALEVETAIVWQNWRAMQDLVVSDVDVEIQTALGPQTVDDQFIIPQNLKSTASYRIGAELAASDLLDVRVGGFYEPTAVAPRYVNVSLVDMDKYQVGAGGSLHLLDGHLDIDFGAALVLLGELQIRNSEVVQTNAGVFNDDAAIVGNGDLVSNGWILGLGASWAFGDPRRTPPGAAAN